MVIKKIQKSLALPNKKGQVWVETVTYTLIAFVLIGLVLSFAKPKIEETKDKILIEQSIKMLRDIDQTITEVGGETIGNKRKIEVNLKKGQLEISPEKDTLVFELESKFLYSEPNQTYYEGDLQILTIEKGKYNKVTIIMNYSEEYEITYKNGEDKKIITKASNPYNFFISNKGGDTLTQIDIEVE